MLDGLLIFVANELDELGIREQLLIDSYRERFFISHWIFNGYVNLKRAVIGPAEALRHLTGARQRAALHVEPDVVPEPDGLDDELVAFPVADRIAVPPRL